MQLLPEHFRSRNFLQFKQIDHEFHSDHVPDALRKISLGLMRSLEVIRGDFSQLTTGFAGTDFRLNSIV